MTLGGFLLLLCYFSSVSTQAPGDETLVIEGAAKIAETDENFVCATIDWWPPEKCNYKQCPWGESSVLNLVNLLHILKLMSKIDIHQFSIF